MRIVFLSLFVLVAVLGCGQSSQEELQSEVDSLRAVNQNLVVQLEQMQDSLRSGASRQSLARADETKLTPPITFPSGSAWLFDRAKERLDQHAQTLKQEYPDAAFRIAGYTDSVPIGPNLKDTYPSNWYLSAQRAAAVAHYLDKEHGIRTNSLEIEALGPRSPVGPNETPEGREQNRRVEIYVEDDS